MGGKRPCGMRGTRARYEKTIVPERGGGGGREDEGPACHGECSVGVVSCLQKSAAHKETRYYHRALGRVCGLPITTRCRVRCGVACCRHGLAASVVILRAAKRASSFLWAAARFSLHLGHISARLSVLQPRANPHRRASRPDPLAALAYIVTIKQ